jgi:hypothetical protein
MAPPPGDAVSLSVALMGHPRRKRFIRKLQKQLPGAELVLDRENDRWETGRRSLLAFDSSATWHCVVQDDAVLCRDFAAGAELVARAAGTERPVGLYVGKVRPQRQTVGTVVKKAKATGAPWLEMKGPLWGVAIIIPTAHIPELVEWGDLHPEIKNYDRRIAAWYEKANVQCWYTLPSLVDHRPVDKNPSLIAGRTGNRRAQWFIGDDSPLEIDWTGAAVKIEGDVIFRHMQTGRRRAARAGSLRAQRFADSPRWEKAA